jgi:hypothetical protein
MSKTHQVSNPPAMIRVVKAVPSTRRRLAEAAPALVPVVLDLGVRRLRRAAPLVRLVTPPSTAFVGRLLRREILRAIEEREQERRRIRRKWLQRGVAIGVVTAAAVGGSPLRRRFT